jgi:phosphatidylethanolamine/phosphatidyl-N-methylethanolamine N-methyltransferase
VREQSLSNVDHLLELDAEDTGFEADRFDIAVAMFVASVVPHPRKLADELRRVVRPGGTILFVNHFAADGGPVWWVERAMAPASRALGWHPDFTIDRLIAPDDATALVTTIMRPFGLFRLVSMVNPA